MDTVEKQSLTLYTDVLVVGSGGAALRAALAARDAGVDVLVVVKGIYAKCGASSYSVAEIGAFNVPDGAVDPQDSPDEYLGDILSAGLGMADPRLSRVLADEAVMAMRDLEEFGVVFERSSDSYLAYQACFSTRPRSHIIKNHFKPIVKALGARVKERGVQVVDRVMVTDLIVVDRQCYGVHAIDLEGNSLVIRAKATVLATGGASQLFAQNLYPPDITGDGYAMAYRAGAQMANMEFMQAGVSLVHPIVNLFNSWLWEAFPRVTNRNGEEFLSKYLEPGVSLQEVMTAKARHFPFSTRDASRYLEIAIQKEINAGGGTERGAVWLDFLDVDFSQLLADAKSDFAKMWPFTYEWYLQRNIDLYRQAVQITCSAHAINGGIRINEWGASSLSGLFAAGETAAGPHGADRLGGNMSVTCQVFGRRAGMAAAAYAKQFGRHPDLPRTTESFRERLASFHGDGKVALRYLKKRLQLAANRSLLIIRSRRGIDDFLHEVEGIEDLLHRASSIGSIRDFIQALEIQNLIDVGRMMAKAAGLREESRGSHYREDFPCTSADWEYNIILDVAHPSGYFKARLADL